MQHLRWNLELQICIISHKIAKDYKISEGDTIRLRDGDLKEIEVRVGGIFENFVYNYIYLRFDTYQEKFGQKPEYKSTYINFSKTITRLISLLLSLKRSSMLFSAV